MTPDQIGEYLEHQGATDDEIDEFLEHFGVKGMKWGVRREQKLQTTRRVAEGKGSFGDKAKVLANQSAISLIRGKGLTGAAERQVAAMETLKSRIESGQATTKDRLNNVGGLNLFTVGGTGGKTIAKKHKPTVEKGKRTAEQNLKLARNITVGMIAGAAVGKVTADLALAGMYRVVSGGV